MSCFSKLMYHLGVFLSFCCWFCCSGIEKKVHLINVHIVFQSYFNNCEWQSIEWKYLYQFHGLQEKFRFFYHIETKNSGKKTEIWIQKSVCTIWTKAVLMRISTQRRQILNISKYSIYPMFNIIQKHLNIVCLDFIIILSSSLVL